MGSVPDPKYHLSYRLSNVYMRVSMYMQLTFKQSYLLAYDPEGTVQNNLQVIFLRSVAWCL